MQFARHELGAIVNALRIAAKQYEGDARTVRAGAPEHEPIAEQFEEQAAEARALADRIECGDVEGEAA